MAFAPMSQDQWDHFLEAWRIFDVDGDGVVTPEDIRALLLSFGYDHSIEVRTCDLLIRTLLLLLRSHHHLLSAADEFFEEAMPGPWTQDRYPIHDHRCMSHLLWILLRCLRQDVMISCTR